MQDTFGDQIPKLANHELSVQAIESLARTIVLYAMDNGWSGPPFDPIKLADILGIHVEGSPDVEDAKILGDAGRYTIYFNPNRPRGRVRFSIAHEIAHTLFSGSENSTNFRTEKSSYDSEQWNIEVLCNIAASEFLMPMATLYDELSDPIDINEIANLREKYAVSYEAVLLRATKIAERPTRLLVCSRDRAAHGLNKLKPDYEISGRYVLAKPELYTKIYEIASRCSATGYTTSDHVDDPRLGRLSVQGIGLPPYPNTRDPRIAVLLQSIAQDEEKTSNLTYWKGNALDPAVPGPKLIVHVVPDSVLNWGGRGFAAQVRKLYPSVHEQYKSWVREHFGSRPKLGSVHICRADTNIHIASVVAQRGHGPGKMPRLKYKSLLDGLTKVTDEALERHASVHMPRIGTGHAGGDWRIVEELIEATLTHRSIPTYVYDVPERTTTPPAQQDLF
jgi:Zn-dependent peptidase ImmA (M78 family)/O-acetyl-ADP-ribose deacetylase (regulator of RNase III)